MIKLNLLTFCLCLCIFTLLCVFDLVTLWTIGFLFYWKFGGFDLFAVLIVLLLLFCLLIWLLICIEWFWCCFCLYCLCCFEDVVVNWNLDCDFWWGLFDVVVWWFHWWWFCLGCFALLVICVGCWLVLTLLLIKFVYFSYLFAFECLFPLVIDVIVWTCALLAWLLNVLLVWFRFDYSCYVCLDYWQFV